MSTPKVLPKPPQLTSSAVQHLPHLLLPLLLSGLLEFSVVYTDRCTPHLLTHLPSPHQHVPQGREPHVGEVPEHDERCVTPT